MYLSCLFFFFKQKTAYEMRISDWSSDVCSSDLQRCIQALGLRGRQAGGRDLGLVFLAQVLELVADIVEHHVGGVAATLLGDHVAAVAVEEIGRASCRDRVCQYV